ncbi:D-alanyl-D-alanine carboxypeptidase [Halomonas sediminis]
MKPFLARSQPGCTALLLMLVFLFGSLAEANPRYAGIVVDLDNGEVLYAENADARRYPASLSKMMTLYLLFEALERGSLKLHQPLPVSSQAAAMPAVKLWLAAGSSIEVDDAIRALTVRSANDVAAVVAEALAGSERQFARLMTQKARELGMQATTFRNASGLPDAAQVSSARDMLTLAVRVRQDFPEYFHYFALQEFTYRGTRHTSHNRLVRNYPGADGMKTGFIRASGFNVATTAQRGSRRLMAIVMGGLTAQSRDAHMADLLDRGFLRASLRDQRTWLASASISTEYMSFPAYQPADNSPATQPLMAALAATSAPVASPSPVENNAAARAIASVSAATATQDAPVQEMGSADDPVARFLQREREMAANTASGQWGIQVGAFSQAAHARQLAQQAARRLTQEFHQARVTVETLQGGPPMFRARLVDFQEDQARQACMQLQAGGMDCMVVNASL